MSNALCVVLMLKDFVYCIINSIPLHRSLIRSLGFGALIRSLVRSRAHGEMLYAYELDASIS